VPGGRDPVAIRLTYGEPLDWHALISFFALRAVAGVERVDGERYRRSLRLGHGSGVVELGLSAGDVGLESDAVEALLWLEDERDLDEAIRRCRMLLDLDARPTRVLAALGGDTLIGGLVRANPGLRVPRHVDPDELAVRAVLGQQVSVRGAATVAGRLVEAYGEPLRSPNSGVTHLFPGSEALADADPERMPMPRARVRALLGLTRALAREEIRLDPQADHTEIRRRLLALPGIGPWTVDYIAMRGLGDSDAFLASDLGTRRALEKLGEDGRPRTAALLAERWRPYRAYAFQHLLAVTMSA
jgi:AraC family transcriptional regulator of adaptative response / DNA-3-methyladenine glycosylase II